MNTKMNGYGNNAIEKANSKEPTENGIASLTNGGLLPAKDLVDKIVVPKKKLVRRKKRREEEPDELAKLGKIKDQQKLDERIKLAVQKLQLCQRVHNFHDPEAQLSSKESKRAALEELLDFLKGQKGAISEKFYGEVFTTVSVNLFRDLPPREDELRPADFELAQQSGGTAGEEETEFGNCEDPAWLHLEPIYELFLQFLGSLEFRATLAKKFIDQQFVLRLLALLQSEDPRERQSLAKILKRIYAKFIRLRPFIRKQTSYLLLTFLTERMPVWGTGELLDILQSVVDDFRVPLKAENKQLLLKVILPLHKPSKCFGQYHSKLADRVVQFIKLDASLTEPAIRTMLKCWPKQNCTKELHFLEELQKILAHMELEEFRKIVDPLFRRISLCICGSHCQVANRALQLWKEEGKISKLLEACNSEIMEKVCAALLQASSQHWNKNVRTLALDVQNALAERNWKLWNKLVAEAKEEAQRQQQQQQQMQNGNGNPGGVEEEEEDENDEKQEVEADDEVRKEENHNHVHEDGVVEDEEEEWTWTWTYEDEEEEEAGEDEEEWEYEYVDEEEPEENGTS